MNQKIQNYLGAAAILSTLLVGFAAFTYSSAYSKSIEPSSFRSFTVRGEGKIVAIPDIAQFNFSVITEGGKDFTSLQRENTEKVNKIIAFLKTNGVDSKDIKTESYNLQPRTQYYTCRPESSESSTGTPVRVCPPSEITGYTITQSVTVKIRDFNKIGEIISGVVTNGANSTNGPFFTIDEPATLENQAREEAIAKAKESAKSIARAGGFRLGRLLSIDESRYIPFKTYETFGRGSAVPDMPAPTPSIEPGSQDVTVTVTLRYEIE